LGDLDINVPDIKGLSRNEAWSVLKRASLNIGLVMYDDDIDDTLRAKIYKQSPDPSEGMSVKPGDSVDLYLR
jgi:beta-lactam-binding protein with PASTA domain